MSLRRLAVLVPSSTRSREGGGQLFIDNGRHIHSSGDSRRSGSIHGQ